MFCASVAEIMGFSFRTMVDQQIIDCNAPFSEMPLKRDKIAPL